MTFETIKEKANKAFKSAPEFLAKTSNYIIENWQSVCAIIVAVNVADSIITENRYKRAKINVMKAEAKSKAAYAKKFGGE